jgi:RHH-type proline utilization regulon transcriptional repressor/proline dehydrogenase/delta 1-pyrroline-5-carboxylate dehydrogenase
MKQHSRDVFQLPLPAACEHGTFVPPTVIEISSLAELQREVFGPVLHIVRYPRDELPHLIEAINSTGYGLTLGIHSRIDETIDFITERAHVGNIYVNRNIVGAVVGVQPFGGEGKSGTGPKAGGPLYLKRLQRHANVTRAAHTIHQQPDGNFGRPAFHSLLSWAGTHGHSRVAALGEAYVHATLLNTSLVLPGPTGERNTLQFAPRGTVLCAAGSVGVLLNQLAACFATGNAAVVCGPTAQLLPAGLPQTVRDAVTVVEQPELASTPLQIALVEPKQLAAWLPMLAAREGALVPVIEATETEPVPLWRLVAERAICVNTTAAGGNASLMTLGG